MKVRSYEMQSLEAIIGVIILSIGLFAGYWATKTEMSEQIAVIEADKQFVYEQMMEYESELSETYAQLSIYKEYKNELYEEQKKNESLQEELTSAITTIDTLKSDEYEFVYVGDFKYTYYCDERYEHICGYGYGLTVSGKPTEVGWTVAADTSVLPMGSIIYIEGVGFREVMDVGGAVDGNHIDILMNTHSECYDQTLINGGVWVLVKKSS